MLQKYNKWLVLKVFFDDPSSGGSGFQLREISRNVGLAPPSVKRYLTELSKEGLVIRTKHRINNYPLYWANRDSESFKFLKKLDILLSLKESGVLDYLNEECMPAAIVLFGSASRGDDMRDSDVDLFLLCKERRLEMQKYEKKIKRKISLFFAKDINELSNELKNNILNGVILKGYLKVF